MEVFRAPESRWQCLGTFLVATTGGKSEYYWHLVGRDQSFHRTSCRARDSPHNGESSGPNRQQGRGPALSVYGLNRSHLIQDSPRPRGRLPLLEAKSESQRWLVPLRLELAPQSELPHQGYFPGPFASEHSHAIRACKENVSRTDALGARPSGNTRARSAVSPASTGCRHPRRAAGQPAAPRGAQCEQERNCRDATVKCWGLFVTAAGVAVTECSTENVVSEGRGFQAIY